MVQAKAEQLQLVFGTQGDDRITAAAKERVFAGAGSDLVEVLEGSDGADLHGGTGDDRLELYGVHSTAYGEQGNDTFTVGGSGSRAHGNEGDDVFHGSGTGHLITGGEGQDTVELAASGSRFSLGAGNDSIRSESLTESNEIYGDRGNDGVYINSALSSLVRGGEGSDSVYAFRSHNIRIEGDQGSDILDAFDSTGVSMYGGVGNDTLNDVAGPIWFYTLDNRYFGNEGDDSFQVAGHKNQYTGGTGNDTFHFSYGNESIDSHIKGDLGDDRVTVEEGSRTVGLTVDGGGGRDLLEVYGANNLLLGGTGEDTLRAYTDYRSLSDGNLFIGGTGEDRYEIGVIGDIYGGGHTIREQGSAGETDTLRFFGGASPGDMRVIREGHSLYMQQGEFGVTVNIEHFFDNAGYRIERFEFEDGTVWTDKEVEQMVQAMAGSTGAGGAVQAQASPEDFPSILLASSPMIP